MTKASRPKSPKEVNEAKLSKIYCKQKGIHCPICSSEQLSTKTTLDIIGDSAWRWAVCENCYSRWTEYYVLGGIMNVILGDGIPTDCKES